MKRKIRYLFILTMVFGMLISVLPLQAIYAEEKNVFVIHYHKNDGSEEVLDKTYTTSDQKLETAVFTEKEKTFIGWNEQADGKGKLYDEHTTVNDVVKDKNATDVYAIWKECYT